ncbi:MAG: hypothetical protein ACK4ND_02835 [Cytophagaceae bacterium]
MKELEIELEKTKRFLHKILYVDFNVITINPKIHQWHMMTWESFYRELLKERVDLYKCQHRNWKIFFKGQKKKINHLMSQLVENIDKGH